MKHVFLVEFKPNGNASHAPGQQILQKLRTAASQLPEAETSSIVCYEHEGLSRRRVMTRSQLLLGVKSDHGMSNGFHSLLSCHNGNGSGKHTLKVDLGRAAMLGCDDWIGNFARAAIKKAGIKIISEHAPLLAQRVSA
jgi:hypothetical protein